MPATQSAGVPGLRFHDLRHTGATLAAASGASLRALMSRIGHSSAAAIAGFAEAAGVRNLVLTHFSARYQANPALSPSIEDVRSEAAALYNGQLILARDLQRYRLDRLGHLQPVAIERKPLEVAP